MAILQDPSKSARTYTGTLTKYVKHAQIPYNSEHVVLFTPRTHKSNFKIIFKTRSHIDERSESDGSNGNHSET